VNDSNCINFLYISPRNLPLTFVFASASGEDSSEKIPEHPIFPTTVRPNMDKQHFLTNTSEYFYDNNISLFTDGDEAMNYIYGSLECQYSATQDVDSSLSKVLS
jgi:hypothetical protein